MVSDCDAKDEGKEEGDWSSRAYYRYFSQWEERLKLRGGQDNL
jgi:hypothetical protein